MPSSSDLSKALLHPIRAKLIMLLGEKAHTALELHRRLPDVPLGTLYRHLNVLQQCHVVQVIAERKVKGTVERQFALHSGADYFTDQQRQELEPYDVARIAGIMASIVSQGFEKFAETAKPPYREGEFSLVTTSLFLSQDEVEEYRHFIQQFIKKQGRQPSEGYERRLVAFFSVPEQD